MAQPSVKFRNPSNGYVEEVPPYAWVWCLLFGLFYLIYKSAWVHALISLGLALLTSGISWLIYPFFVRSILINSYRRRGWIEVTEGNVTPVTAGGALWVPSEQPERPASPSRPSAVAETYRGFDIQQGANGFSVLGQDYPKISQARAAIDEAFS